MPSAPDEEDPLSDLRQSFEGDVAPSPTPTERGSGSVRSASGPPPLPTKRSTSERKREGVVSAPPVAHVPRSLEDPFQEPSEPRLPHGLPEEKLEFFRVVLKQKQETLARARALYAQREAEIHSLTEAVNSVRAQMDSALTELEREQQRSQQVEVRVTQLQAELQASDQDRRDSSAALAEVEAQVVAMTEAATCASTSAKAADESRRSWSLACSSACSCVTLTSTCWERCCSRSSSVNAESICARTEFTASVSEWISASRCA